MISNDGNGSEANQNPREYHKFAQDLIWVSAAQVFVGLILGIITLPALTKSYTPELYGIWIQVNVTIDLMSPLLSLQLGLAAVRFLAGEENASRRRHLGSMLFAIVVFTLIVCLVGIPFSKQLSTLIFASSEYVRYIWLTVAWTFVNVLYNFLLTYLQARSKNRAISIIQISVTVIKVVIIVGLAEIGMSLAIILLGLILLQTAFSVGILALITKEDGFPQPNSAGLKTFLGYSIPQIPSFVMLWIIQRSDRYFITHFLGLTQDGIYSSSITLAGIATLFYFPISFVLFPLISRFWKEQRFGDVKIYFVYSLRFFLTLAIPGLVGITVLSQPLLKLLTPEQFLAGKELVLVLTLGFILFGIYQINSTLILLDKRAKLLPIIVTIGAAANIVINIVFIPRIGIIGAAVSSCVSFFVLAFLSTLWVGKIVRYVFDFKYFGKVIASALAMLGCVFFLKGDNIGDIILVILVGATAYGGSLFLLRAFSNEDKRLAGRILASIVPSFQKNKQ